MQQKVAVGLWSPEIETTFKRVYEKNKAEFWKALSQQMGAKVDWRFLETKAFELGKKGLKCGELKCEE